MTDWQYLLALPKSPFCSPFSSRLESSERLCRAARAAPTATAPGSDVFCCDGAMAAEAETFRPDSFDHRVTQKVSDLG